MIWHNSTPQQIAEELNTDITSGLSSADAVQKLKDFGYNELRHNKKISFLSYLKDGLKSIVFITLVIVALINFVLSATVNLSNLTEHLLIVIFAIISVLIASLLKYLSDRILNNASNDNDIAVTVIRDNTETVIKSSELVPGDIMIINTGDYIKADGRLIDSYALTCDEYMVSGDIAPSEKMHDLLLEDITPLVNRHNMIYSGSNVLGGRGVAIVTETGMSTEAGMRKDISKQLEETETPISLSLKKIKNTYSKCSLILSIIIFFTGIIVNFTNTNVSFAITVASSLLFACCVAFSVGSNLIPSLITFSRACSMQRLKAKGIIVNSKIVAEELKDVTVICTDKTGVLTTEELTVVKAYSGSGVVNLKDNRGDESVAALLRLALICSNFSKDEHGERHTNNIERSIESACIDYVGMSKTDIDGLYPKIAEIPFNSDRMLMTTVSAISGNPISITKGAPEIILSRCENINAEEIMQIASSFAKEGLRVIAVAIKQLDEIPANPNCDELENDLTFVGIIGIEDNISPKAARVCIEAADFGIKTIMVTGDHIDTAIAISKKAGIISSSDEAISGEELAHLSDEELVKSITKYSVFARISPEDKLRIVAAFKANNEKVLITGDSINDAQALLEADFGCALGTTASDLVADSADIVIKDNHYSSIILAIKESAKLYLNVKKALLHLSTIALSLLLISTLGLIIFGLEPIKAPLLLLYSLILTFIPLFAIFLDGAKKVMEPTSAKNKLFDSYFVLRTLIPSIIIAIATFIAFAINLSSGYAVACSSAFLTLAFGVIAQALCAVPTTSFFNKNLLQQKYNILICFSTILLLILIMTTSIGALLSLTPVTTSGWFVGIIVFVLVVIINEVLKHIKRFVL